MTEASNLPEFPLAISRDPVYKVIIHLSFPRRLHLIDVYIDVCLRLHIVSRGDYGNIYTIKSNPLKRVGPHVAIRVRTS